jgi:hypothetical protein
MIRIFRYRRCLISGLALPLLLLFIVAPVMSGNRSNVIRVEKITPAFVDDVIIISYDLLAPPQNKYEVSLVLRRESDRAFKFIPRTVSGAIGKGQSAGDSREIRWQYKQDAPRGFKGKDYYFIIRVKKTGGGKAGYILVLLAMMGGAASVFHNDILKILSPD